MKPINGRPWLGRGLGDKRAQADPEEPTPTTTTTTKKFECVATTANAWGNEHPRYDNIPVEKGSARDHLDQALRLTAQWSALAWGGTHGYCTTGS